jgi:DNA-binding response OmpR family regulator
MCSEKKQKRILLVDDEQRFVSMLAKRINLNSGYSPEVAYDGRSALRLLKDQEFILVLLDLFLPDIHGVEVLRQIRQKHPAMPVIILTGHGSEKDKQVCMELGACAFLNKPVNMPDLLNTFAEAEKAQP